MGPNAFLRTTNFRLWWINRLGSRFGSGSVIPGAQMGGRPGPGEASQRGRAEVRQGCGGRKKERRLVVGRRQKKKENMRRATTTTCIAAIFSAFSNL
jgi:hypothetical protein